MPELVKYVPEVLPDEFPARKEFNQIVATLRVQIPAEIEETIFKLNGLGSLLTAGDWARAAFVRAWVEPQQGKRNLGENSSKLTVKDFASLGIQGLTTRDAVRHYWNAWEGTRRPVPKLGEIVDLPKHPFPEWGSNTGPHVAQNSGENEWYTPPEFIEAARAVMGGIDCDPASSAIANKTVKAEKFYTAEEDGLDKEWGPRVWMNPPYAQPLIAEFSEGIASRFESGEIQQACVLVNNATDTGWFQRMMLAGNAVVFIRTRVRFLDPDGNPSGAPLQGQCVIYFGENKEEFYNEFSRFGIVLKHANV